jgi:cytochrome c peroxidase
VVDNVHRKAVAGSGAEVAASTLGMLRSDAMSMWRLPSASAASWFAAGLVIALALLGSARWLPRRAAEPAFSAKAFEEALARSAGREVLQRFYRRPSVAPLRSQTLRYRYAATRALGERLFSDTRLATHAGMACATCHQPAVSFSDHLPRSVEANRRRSMTLHNLAWSPRFTWDGRAGSLMSQAVLALEAVGGMNTRPEELVRRLGALPEYRALFGAAFVDVPGTPGERVSFAKAMWAIEVFVHSLVSGEAPFDRWIQGDAGAISPAAVRGFDLFNGKAGCASCHHSWRFTDDERYDLGLPEETALRIPNLLFKTPGLREVSLRPPYMHDGSLATLDEVLAFYNRGGGLTRPSKSSKLQPLGLSGSELEDLKSFLLTLTADRPRPVR